MRSKLFSVHKQEFRTWVVYIHTDQLHSAPRAVHCVRQLRHLSLAWLAPGGRKGDDHRRVHRVPHLGLQVRWNFELSNVDALAAEAPAAFHSYQTTRNFGAISCRYAQCELAIAVRTTQRLSPTCAAAMSTAQPRLAGSKLGLLHLDVLEIK
jgi:hypothetical protein